MIRPENRDKPAFRALRLMLGIPQKMIAQKTGVSVLTVKRWGNPNTSVQPSAEAWLTLAQYAGDETALKYVKRENGVTLLPMFTSTVDGIPASMLNSQITAHARSLGDQKFDYYFYK